MLDTSPSVHLDSLWRKWLEYCQDSPRNHPEEEDIHISRYGYARQVEGDG